MIIVWGLYKCLYSYFDDVLLSVIIITWRIKQSYNCDDGVRFVCCSWSGGSGRLRRLDCCVCSWRQTPPSVRGSTSICREGRSSITGSRTCVCPSSRRSTSQHKLAYRSIVSITAICHLYHCNSTDKRANHVYIWREREICTCHFRAINYYWKVEHMQLFFRFRINVLSMNKNLCFNDCI